MKTIVVSIMTNLDRWRHDGVHEQVDDGVRSHGEEVVAEEGHCNIPARLDDLRSEPRTK